MEDEKKKKKKSTWLEAPPAIAEAEIVEKEAPPKKLEPEKPKPGRLVRVNPGRLDRIRG